MSKRKTLKTYAQQFASKGGLARMAGMTSDQRIELARKAGSARKAPKASPVPAV